MIRSLHRVELLFLPFVIIICHAGLAAEDAEKVVEYEDLAVGRAAGADPDHRDRHPRHQRLGDLRRDRLEDDREAARLLQRQRHEIRPLHAVSIPIISSPLSGDPVMERVNPNIGTDFRK